LAEFVTERVDALLGAALFFVAPSAAKSRVIAAFRQAVEEGARFEKAATFLGADFDGAGTVVDCLLVRFYDQFRADGFYEFIAELYHFVKLVGCIDVQQREGDLAWEERLLSQPNHD